MHSNSDKSTEFASSSDGSKIDLNSILGKKKVKFLRWTKISVHGQIHCGK